MRLVSISPEHLESQQTLPFDLFDAQGQLLLAAKEPLNDPEIRAKLRGCRGIFGEAQAVAVWRRRLAATMDELLRRNVPLSQIVKARPDLSPAMQSALKPGEEWEEMTQALEAALRDVNPDKPWLERVLDILSRARTQAVQRMDEALFHFIYQGARHTDQYSSHQALRCMLVAGEVARCLKWDEPLVDLLERSALTMNVAMRRLQNTLAEQRTGGLDAATREQISRHPADGARLLHDSGVEDAAWLEAVRLHHDASVEQVPLAQRTPGQRVAVLLRRVDIYSAKLSRRAGRAPMTAMQAARDVCLGPDGRPDQIGAALLKAMGLYPPGSFVQLESREAALVMARSEQANQPWVAVLTNAQGVPLAEPRLRDTAQPGYAVRAALRPDQVTVELPRERVMALHAAVRKLRSLRPQAA